MQIVVGFFYVLLIEKERLKFNFSAQKVPSISETLK